MKVKSEFSGGLELIFKQKELEVKIDKESITIQELVDELKSYIKERPEFFLTKDGGIRPGILVLINDADWEIYDKELTTVSNGDSVSFISTLHGG